MMESEVVYGALGTAMIKGEPGQGGKKIMAVQHGTQRWKEQKHGVRWGNARMYLSLELSAMCI